MSKRDHALETSPMADQIVRGPRATDSVGRALRGVFRPTMLSPELQALMDRLDRTPD